jgi:hypothetical protein
MEDFVLCSPPNDAISADAPLLKPPRGTLKIAVISR